MDEKLSAEHLKNIKQLLTILLPEIDSFLHEVEKDGGWLNLGDDLIQIIHNLKISDWAKYYEDPKTLKAFIPLMSYTHQELKNMAKTPLESKAKITKEFIDEFNENQLKHPNPDELDKFKTDFENASNEEQVEVTKQISLLILSMLTNLFNYLALMLHGKSICTLIGEAKNGNDDSLCEAIHIDRTILYLPFVQERIIKAQLGKDKSFLNKIGRRISTPILSGKIRYRKLYLAFAILDDEGYLEMPREGLLDLLIEVGVYGKEYGNEDVGYLSKRLNEYKKKNMQLNYF